ncbi:hypothetical protein SSS_03773, partial [Sarcoptes scabiei]
IIYPYRFKKLYTSDYLFNNSFEIIVKSFSIIQIVSNCLLLSSFRTSILLDRAYFNQHNQPAFLQIDPVRTSDAGEYRCRVDFKKARTVNIVIQLKVIVPPEEPIISTNILKVLPIHSKVLLAHSMRVIDWFWFVHRSEANQDQLLLGGKIIQ